MQHTCRMQHLAVPCRNQKGVTFLMAMFIISIMGIMLGMTGQAWKTIMQREREKELLFRGSQIKEAIENWYNTKYTVPGTPPRARVHPLMDLKDLLLDPYSLTPVRYLPQHYEMDLDDRDAKCAPDCAKRKIYQDPMTGKEWTLIRDSTGVSGVAGATTGIQGGGIIGVASKSDAKPFRTEFKDTALENIGMAGMGASAGTGVPTLNIGGALPPVTDPGTNPAGGPDTGKPKKYSEWKFVADPKNDHSKIYRAYHEGW